MKKRISKLLCLILTVVMVASLAACGGNTESAASVTTTSDTSATATTEAQVEKVAGVFTDTEPVTLDWYVDENWYTRVKWGQDLTSKYITEKTGVSLNIIIPQGDNTSKRTIMIASGDLPDIMGMGQWWPEWKSMLDNGDLYSFQELSEKYDKDFFSVTKKSILDYYTAKDGKNYVYPNAVWPSEDLANAKYLTAPSLSVRKDMYEAIGKPDMSTPEGFLNALKLAKEKFPEVNDQPIIPFLLSQQFVADGQRDIDSTLPILLNIPYAQDGQFNRYALRTSTEMVTWLDTFRKAYQQGYITRDQFTDKDSQITIKMQSGRVFATMFATNTLIQYNGEFYKNDPNTIYIPVAGIKNSKGEDSKAPMGGLAGWHVNMITKNCKNPEKAIQFFHYWLSEEGQSDFFYGDPSMYEMRDGKKYMKDEIYNLRDTNEQEFCSKYGGRDSYFMLHSETLKDQWRQGVKPYEQPYYDFAKGKNYDASEFEGCDPEPNTPADVELQKFKAKWGQLLPKIIIAKSDEDFNKFLNELKEAYDKGAEVFGSVIQEKYVAKKTALNK